MEEGKSLNYYILVKYDEDWKEQLHPTNIVVCKTKEAAENQKEEYLKKFKHNRSWLRVEEVQFINQ